MISYNYMIPKQESEKDKLKRIDVVQLLKKTKLKQKKEKRQSIYIAAVAVSILAISGFIISQ